MSMGLIRRDEVLGPKPKSEQSVDASKEEPHEPTIAEELGEKHAPANLLLFLYRYVLMSTRCACRRKGPALLLPN
jgi:hypothetical protein